MSRARCTSHPRRERRSALRHQPTVVLTPRDDAILIDLVRFALTANQLRRHHFPGSRSLGTVWNRLRRLRLAGSVVRVPVGPIGTPASNGQATHAAAAYLATAQGAHAVGVALRPARHRGSGPVALRHALVVAGVADVLLARRYQHGQASWVTERELRAGALATRSEGPLGRLLTPIAGVGWPDGVLVVTGPDGAPARAAVEVELHAKATRLYAPKLAWYRRLLAAGALDRVCWYCATPAVVTAVRRAAQAAGILGPAVTVELLPEAPAQRHPGHTG